MFRDNSVFDRAGRYALAIEKLELARDLINRLIQDPEPGCLEDIARDKLVEARREIEIAIALARKELR